MSILDRSAGRDRKVHYVNGPAEIGRCGIDAPLPYWGTSEIDDVTCRRCLRLLAPIHYAPPFRDGRPCDDDDAPLSERRVTDDPSLVTCPRCQDTLEIG